MQLRLLVWLAFELLPADKKNFVLRPMGQMKRANDEDKKRG